MLRVGGPERVDVREPAGNERRAGPVEGVVEPDAPRPLPELDRGPAGPAGLLKHRLDRDVRPGLKTLLGQNIGQRASISMR